MDVYGYIHRIRGHVESTQSVVGGGDVKDQRSLTLGYRQHHDLGAGGSDF